MGAVDDLARHILGDLVADFREKNLGADALRKEYDGCRTAALELKYCAQGSHSKVDFDLALKQLEQDKLVGTGPMEPYENSPGSHVIVVAFFSKREFVYLTEKGYRAAQKTPVRSASVKPSLSFEGATFNHSQVGIGDAVSQAATYNVESDAEVVEQLVKLIALRDPVHADDRRARVEELVGVAGTGDLAKAKSLFQRLFGMAKDVTKQFAWELIIAYATKRLGI